MLQEPVSTTMATQGAYGYLWIRPTAPLTCRAIQLPTARISGPAEVQGTAKPSSPAPSSRGFGWCPGPGRSWRESARHRCRRNGCGLGARGAGTTSTPSALTYSQPSTLPKLRAPCARPCRPCRSPWASRLLQIRQLPDRGRRSFSGLGRSGRPVCSNPSRPLWTHPPRQQTASCLTWPGDLYF